MLKDHLKSQGTIYLLEEDFQDARKEDGLNLRIRTTKKKKTNKINKGMYSPGIPVNTLLDGAETGI